MITPSNASRQCFLLLCTLLFSFGCSNLALTQAGVVAATALPDLPIAIANNAVASIDTDRGVYLTSFNGIRAGKNWDDTSAQAFVLAPGASRWRQIADVPGGHGRLASVAVSAGPHAYIFGGYTVAEDHSEVSLPVVHRFDPQTLSYQRLADMPVPVDDAVALVYQRRYIYLISGWHDSANVNLVQLYDIETDKWVQATAYPGPPVFGHAGGIVGDQLLICGGVKIKTHAREPREFVMNRACFAGQIRADNIRRIDWRTIDPMPGAARYRMAAAGSALNNRVVFIGGSDNPYNYDGVGYNKEPSEPVASLWQFDFRTDSWNAAGRLSIPTMDHRALLIVKDQMITVGGMKGGQAVSNAVLSYQLPRK